MESSNSSDQYPLRSKESCERLGEQIAGDDDTGNSTRTTAALSPIPGHHEVYLAESLGNGKRNHQAIYVETDSTPSEETGFLYHVKGSTLLGMKFEAKRSKNPKYSPTFLGQQRIGQVTELDFARVEEVCRTVPPPKAQLRLNGSRINPSEPLRTCQEWVAEAAMALRAANVMRDVPAGSPTSSQAQAS